MKVKYEKCGYSILGKQYIFYIKYVKNHWWNKYQLIMDGNVPQHYQLINGEFIAEI